MKNNFLNILGAACLILFIGSSMTSCSAEDGVDGINGIDGSDGANGLNGADGQDGTDGANGLDAIGLEEFANYGSIALKLEGIRPDDVAFEQETELEFISPEFFENGFRDDNPDLEFNFLRLVKAPNAEQVNSTRIEFYVSNPGSTSQEFEFNIEFSDFAIVSEDLKFIILSDYFSGTSLTNSDNNNNNNTDKVVDTNDSPNTFSISDYSFDDTTNNLKFSFEMDVPADNNQTGHDLSIEGTVNVVVFENISVNG